MRHRHLNHRGYTLASIDDIIERGSMAAWEDLRDAGREPEVRDRIARVCAARAHDPEAQRHHFWRLYVSDKETAS